MAVTEIPMHLPGGPVVSLRQILATLPKNDWVWKLLELSAMGYAPGGVGMVEFEDHVLSLPDGLLMSWAELQGLGAGLDQTVDCEIFGYRDGTSRLTDEWIVRLEAHDSTLWQIEVDESAVDLVGVLDAVQALVAVE